MYWIPIILLAVFLFLFEFFTSRKWLRAVIITALAAIIMGIIIWIDYDVQTHDTEVWSGQITDWKHKPSWNEWHPSHTTCTKDSNGHKTCHTTPGYWEHHPAENYVETSDDGLISVNYSPDGRHFNDYFPNSTSELASMFPKGTPTASTHAYVNKIQASYSIFRHKNIDLKQYPNLPNYPENVHDYFYVDRILGDVPNKTNALKELDKINTELNKPVPDPKNKGKTRSWKEANLIFVNLGPKTTINDAYALQDKWQGGKKNDFVVAFSMDKNGDVKWAYPFTWSDSSLLKIETKQYMESLKGVKDFIPVMQHVEKDVIDKFSRKQFADFNYLQVGS